MPPGLKLRDADMELVESLHKKGLLYLEVPIRPDDHVSIPPLEVSCLCIWLDFLQNILNIDALL